MRAVVQRVDRASVTVEGSITGQIDKGLLVLLGVAEGDTEKDLAYIVDKVCGLRIFEDEAGKMNLSVQDCGRQHFGCEPVYAVRRLPQGQAP